MAVWVPWTLGIGNSLIRDVVCALVAVVVTILAMRNLGLYQSRVCAQRSAEVVRTLTAVGVGTATFVALQWMAGNGRVSALRAAEAAALAATVVLLVRWRFGRWLKARRSSGRFLRTVVLVGTNDDALALWTTLEGEPELGYRVGAMIGDRRLEAPWSELPFSTDIEDIGDLAKRVGANGVIVVGSALNSSGGGDVVERALAAGLHLQVWPGLSGLASRRVRMAPVSGVPFLYIEPLRGISKWNEFGKRAMDLVGGSCAVPYLLTDIPRGRCAGQARGPRPGDLSQHPHRPPRSPDHGLQAAHHGSECGADGHDHRRPQRANGRAAVQGDQ